MTPGLFKSFSKLAKEAENEENDVVNGTKEINENNFQCKVGVGGEACDRCLAGYFGFGDAGCKPCSCELTGTVDGKLACEPETGKCQCKAHVEGDRCEKCKEGFIGLSSENPLGCSPCLCNNQACQSVEGYYVTEITSKFDQGKDSWKASFVDESTAEDLPLRWVKEEEAIAVHSVPNGDPIYFLVPEKFTGNQLPSYNQWLSFEFRIAKDGGKTGPNDILILGADGKNISFPLTAQQNPKPTKEFQQYRYHLHYAKVDEAFLPLQTIASGLLSALKPIMSITGKMKEIPKIPMETTHFGKEYEFLRILQNVASLKIRGTYSSGDIGYLRSFSLGSASQDLPTLSNPQKADWIGQCACQENTAGEFCDTCASGYRKVAQKHFFECTECECNGHTEKCDPENGHCWDCNDGSIGDHCDRCDRGYFGNPLMVNGTMMGCQKCPCSDGVSCVQDLNEKPICLTE
ncbi:unnamed protein product, partial [Mesorhabditis belari]|uniref:Uncharacterized protein n=1 Tax=Mesorhabditis belari TaxID=2138241 RepID=A0AAF3ES09_9BILA